MFYYAVAFFILLHVLFWGAGLSLLLTPRFWRNYWLVFCAPAGIALQSLTVWIGAYADLEGTKSYAHWSELIPVALLGWALVRIGKGRGRFFRLSLQEFWAIGLIMAVCLSLLVLPLSRASRSLTTASLGSCDAADYAAGARVMQEFRHSDRVGFIGQTEVVQVRSTTNFYDFWLRLNHFTPSALIALNGAVLALQPYQTAGVLTAVLLVLSLPLIYWLARTLLRYRPGPALWITLIYGISPINWYAVYHVAIGQLIAAQAIALLTCCGVTLWRRDGGWRQGLTLEGLLFVGYALVLGAYNFILLVCLVPAVAFAGGCALWTGGWERFARWVGLMLLPLAAAAIVNTERVLGLIERFSLFKQYDFGWRIPALSPEGWLGMVSSEGLDAWSPALRVALAAVTVGLFLSVLGHCFSRRAATAYLLIALTLPVLLGYAYLILRGLRFGTNASYDAYKLFSVFYPELLVALCSWLAFLSSPRRIVRWSVIACAVMVLGFNIYAASRFGMRMTTPPLIVDRDLTQTARLEGHPEVESLNMNVTEFWERLWANSFLLRKRQFFATHTYEGRLNTALNGDWDLNGGLIQVRLPDSDSIVLNANYSAAHTSSPYFLRASFGEGWHDLERLPNATTRWRWSRGDASLLISNPQSRPLRLVCRINARSLREQDIAVFSAGKSQGAIRVGVLLRKVELPPITVSLGMSVIELRLVQDSAIAAPADARTLGLAVYGMEIQVLR